MIVIGQTFVSKPILIQFFALFQCRTGLLRSFQVFLDTFNRNCGKSFSEPIMVVKKAIWTNTFLAISQRLANLSGYFWYHRSLFCTNFPDRKRFWVDNLGKEIFFRICWFGGSKLEATLRAAENFIKSPFHPTAKVYRVSQPSFKSGGPLLETFTAVK